jgi:hypothetical protein
MTKYIYFVILNNNKFLDSVKLNPDRIFGACPRAIGPRQILLRF